MLLVDPIDHPGGMFLFPALLVPTFPVPASCFGQMCITPFQYGVVLCQMSLSIDSITSRN
jgi:hypothetical protein